jgi:hypothetical protein
VSTLELRSSDTAEKRLSGNVRQAALDEIRARSLDEEQLASILGVSQTVVYLLWLKESWPLPVSVRVADALGLHVDVTIKAGS